MTADQRGASAEGADRKWPASGTRPIAYIPKPKTWACTIPDAHHAGVCARCGLCPGPFRDGLSLAEYRISAMCQSCQDDFFEENPKSAWDTSTDYGPREG